jgi:hypothetical protein
MSRARIIVLAFCSLVAGFICGGLLVGFAFGYYAKVTSAGMKAEPYTGAWQTLNVLKNLRNGDTQVAIESLEFQLDGNLVLLWGWNKDTPVGKRDPHLLKLLSDVRDYRSNYPRAKKYPEMEGPVTEVLSWTDAQASR